MTRHALACLEGIKDAGPWSAVAELLRAEAARRERRFGDAADSLEAAAQLMPPPIGKSLWLAVSMCHRRAGNVDRAIESLAHARGAFPPRARPKAE
ncbi:MAG: hypothetical protein A2V70_17190 [Planctomycetes bacterium RBG_13_63_9]|nr:MAG: hypothetical protein A2V70_17190 [Planctomycetes bacterium RBG_13_63_9]